MNRDEQDLYDAAIAEVRGEENANQRATLAADPRKWRAALRQVIDEIDSQKEFKQETLDTIGSTYGKDSSRFTGAAEAFVEWQEKVGVFRKYISARLVHVDRICKDSPLTQNSTEAPTDTIDKLKALAAITDEYDDDDDKWFDAVYDLLDAVNSL